MPLNYICSRYEINHGTANSSVTGAGINLNLTNKLSVSLLIWYSFINTKVLPIKDNRNDYTKHINYLDILNNQLLTINVR